MKLKHTIIFVFLLVVFVAVSGFADENPQSRPNNNSREDDRRIEIPVYGVRIIPEYCTKEIDISGKSKEIEISYQVFINPESFRDLNLSFTCREISENANKIVEYAALDLPEDSRVYTFNFSAPDFETKLVFQLQLTPKNLGDSDPAYSQEFTCNVFSSAKKEKIQTKPAETEILEVILDKPVYKIEKQIDKLIDADFYNFEIKLNVKVKNPRLPIHWLRKVDYTCNKTLPEYLKNTLPSTGKTLEREIAYIEALPPGKTQNLQQTTKLTYVKDMFPLTYNQYETIKIGEAEYTIEIKFKILSEKNFPPAITVKLISDGKNLQTFTLQ